MSHTASTDRRDFLARSVQGAALVTTGALGWFYLLKEQGNAAAEYFRPPGAESADDFYAKCIKCGQCVQACPFDTLKLAASGIPVPVGTPYFRPQDIPCYMCPDIPCQQVCPTGAISPELESIDQARMGLANIDIENCLSWQGLRCEICYRECPLKNKAISIANQPRKLSKHAMFVPLVHSDACTGCGICEKACPTDKAAIRVAQPELVRGQIGSHYRLGWKQGVKVEEAVTPQPTQDHKSDDTLNYLNSNGSE